MKLHMTSPSSDPIRVRWVPTIFMSVLEWGHWKGWSCVVSFCDTEKQMGSGETTCLRGLILMATL